jgi:hypothetical protein
MTSADSLYIPLRNAMIMTGKDMEGPGDKKIK